MVVAAAPPAPAGADPQKVMLIQARFRGRVARENTKLDSQYQQRHCLLQHPSRVRHEQLLEPFHKRLEYGFVAQRVAGQPAS